MDKDKISTLVVEPGIKDLLMLKKFFGVFDLVSVNKNGYILVKFVKKLPYAITIENDGFISMRIPDSPLIDEIISSIKSHTVLPKNVKIAQLTSLTIKGCTFYKTNQYL